MRIYTDNDFSGELIGKTSEKNTVTAKMPRQCSKGSKRLFCFDLQPSVVSSVLTLTWIYQFLHTVQSHVFFPVWGGCMSRAGPRLSVCHCCCHLLSLKYCNCINPQPRSCYTPHVLIWHVLPPPSPFQPPPPTHTYTHITCKKRRVTLSNFNFYSMLDLMSKCYLEPTTLIDFRHIYLNVFIYQHFIFCINHRVNHNVKHSKQSVEGRVATNMQWHH